MPEMKRFIVTQKRIVTVDANNAEDAARIAQYAFEYGQIPGTGIDVEAFGEKHRGKIHPLEGVWGNTASRIEVVNLTVDKK